MLQQEGHHCRCFERWNSCVMGQYSLPSNAIREMEPMAVANFLAPCPTLLTSFTLNRCEGGYPIEAWRYVKRNGVCSGGRYGTKVSVERWLLNSATPPSTNYLVTLKVMSVFCRQIQTQSFLIFWKPVFGINSRLARIYISFLAMNTLTLDSWKRMLVSSLYQSTHNFFSKGFRVRWYFVLGLQRAGWIRKNHWTYLPEGQFFCVRWFYGRV